MLSSDLWPAVADAGQFESALVNLPINARDGIQGSGLLTIETKNPHPVAASCRQHAEVQPGDIVLLTVPHTGTGTAPAGPPNAPRPLSTTKPPRHGPCVGTSNTG